MIWRLVSTVLVVAFVFVATLIAGQVGLFRVAGALLAVLSPIGLVFYLLAWCTAGALTMTFVRIIGIHSWMHDENHDGKYGKCSADCIMIGRYPIPFWVWFVGVVLWPMIWLTEALYLVVALVTAALTYRF